MRRSACAREVEVHHPLATGLRVRGEFPLSSGLAGNPREIVTRPGVVKAVIDHVARRIDRDTHCNFHVAMDGGESAMGHVGYFFVEDAG